jgi:hypothetical protein
MDRIPWTIRCTKILKHNFKEKTLKHLPTLKYVGISLKYFPGKNVSCGPVNVVNGV